MSDRPSLRSAYVAELGSAVRGAGPARATAVVLALALVGLLAGRRLAQGPLVGSGAFDVTVQVLRELLPILVMPAAGLRYAIRRQQGVDQAQHLAGVQPAARLAVVGADATLLLGSAEIAAVAAVAVGAGGLTAQPLRDLGTLLVGTLWCVGVLASVSALAARVAGSAAGFLAVGLGAPVVGSLLGWAGWVYPVLDRLAQVWPWRAATAFLQVGSAGQWWVSAGASVVTLAATIGGLVAAAADRTGAPRRPAEPTEHAAGTRAAGRSTWRVVAASAGAALVWGVAGPATLSPFVPWYLRPQWLADEARHQSSQDVATAWLRAVQARDFTTADRLGIAPARRLAGPLAAWLPAQDPGSALMDRSYAGNPGTVQFSSGRSTVFVCLRRSAVGWLVSAVRSADDCRRMAS